MTQVSEAGEVLDEVQELAEEVQQYQPGLSDAEARAVVWGELPELYDEYRNSTPEPDPGTRRQNAPGTHPGGRGSRGSPQTGRTPRLDPMARQVRR